MSKYFLLSTTVFSFLFPSTILIPDRIICYYQSGSIPPERINIEICTQLNYAFLGINEDGSIRFDGSPDIVFGVSALKKRKPDLKVLFSLGGWGEGSERFSHVAANDSKIAVLVKDTLDYIKRFNYDGLDLDWEYPAKRNGTPADKENFIHMLRQLKEAFIPHNYLLTAAVNCDPTEESYDVEALNLVLDYVNIMTYDYHSDLRNKTESNAPLYPLKNTTEEEKIHYNVNASVHNWLNKGIDRQKLILGLAFYGRTYKLADQSLTFVGAPAVGEGHPGFMDYKVLCQKNWTYGFSSEELVPYVYNEDDWISYDDIASIQRKVKFASKMKLGGVMLWAVDCDDYAGSCGEQYPLLKAIKRAMF